MMGMSETDPSEPPYGGYLSLRAAIGNLVGLFVAKEFAIMVPVTRGRFMTAEDIEEAFQREPGTLVLPAAEALDEVQFTPREVDGETVYDSSVRLWLADGERSRLVMKVRQVPEVNSFSSQLLGIDSD